MTTERHNECTPPGRERRHLGHDVQAAYERLAGLHRRSQGLTHLPEPLLKAFEELGTVLEELHGAEEELQAQNEALREDLQRLDGERRRYQNLFEFAPRAYVVTDAQGVIREANRAAATLLGFGPQSPKGKPLALFVGSEERPAFQTRVHELAARAGTGELSIRVQPLEGAPLVASAMVAILPGEEDGTPHPLLVAP